MNNFNLRKEFLETLEVIKRAWWNK